MKGETKRGIVLAWTLEKQSLVSLFRCSKATTVELFDVRLHTSVVYVLDSVPRRKQEIL
jgi:hypothetical protein